MSFLSHIGLSVIDKLTGNALDKLGNAIKDGDVSGIVEQFTDILEGVEDKLGDASDLFEEAIESGKKDIRREIAQVKRKLVRETRKELAGMHGEFLEALGRRFQNWSRWKSPVAWNSSLPQIRSPATADPVGKKKKNPNAAQALRSRYRPSRWPGLRRTKPSWQSWSRKTAFRSWNTNSSRATRWSFASAVRSRHSWSEWDRRPIKICSSMP